MDTWHNTPPPPLPLSHFTPTLPPPSAIQTCFLQLGGSGSEGRLVSWVNVTQPAINSTDVDHWDETSQQSLFWSHVAIINRSQLIDFTVMMRGKKPKCAVHHNTLTMFTHCAWVLGTPQTCRLLSSSCYSCMISARFGL